MEKRNRPILTYETAPFFCANGSGYGTMVFSERVRVPSVTPIKTTYHVVLFWAFKYYKTMSLMSRLGVISCNNISRSNT